MKVFGSSFFVLVLVLVFWGSESRAVQFDFPSELEKLWPKEVVMPPTMKVYQRSVWTQHLTIMNGSDRLAIVHQDTDDYSEATVDGFGRVIGGPKTTVNPNRIFPWKVSGGLDKAIAWKGTLAIAIPEGQHIRYWGEKIEAGASRPLPRNNWQYPVGTVVADMIQHEDGRLFELRTLTRRKDGTWHNQVVWGSGILPKGYNGHAGFKCHECHDRAGSRLEYGPLVRGADGVFSFWPFEKDSFIPRKDFPVKHWNDVSLKKSIQED